MMFSKLEKSVKTTRFAVSGTAMARRLRVPHFTESAVSVPSGSFATLTETSVLATSPHCDGERNGGLLPHMDLIEQPDRADTGDLLCELCESRDARLFLSIVAAVDAGVDTARDKGEGDDLKERDAPHIPEHGNTDKVCVFPDYKAGRGR